MSSKAATTITQVTGPNLVVESLRDEMVIFDRNSNKAHMLDAAAASIWKAAKNGCAVDEVLPLVQADSDEKRRALVQLAISELERAGLLMSDAPAPIPRRGLLKTLGAAAAIPLVVSILAPTPAAAASGLADGATCTALGQCTSPRDCTNINKGSGNCCVSGTTKNGANGDKCDNKGAAKPNECCSGVCNQVCTEKGSPIYCCVGN